MPEKMLLLDGNSLMYRAFHALPLLDNGEGVYTNAAFGFLSMLMKALKDIEPTLGAAAFDLHGPTFRHAQYAQYKAGRAPTPDELRPQFDLIREILEAMHFPIVTCPRYEADDILGTLSLRCEEAGIDARIVTGDRDAYQLAGAHTTILYTKRGISDTESVDPAYLRATYDLTPEQMIDLKGLMGDHSDNIPGVPGVGEKTALKLLKEFGSLEEALAQAESTQKGKLRERLIEFAQQALFSKRMATIERHAPVNEDIFAMRLHDMRDAAACMEKYHLTTLVKRLATLPAALLGGNGARNAADEQTQAPSTAAPVEDEGIVWKPIETLADADALAYWADSQAHDQDLALSFGAEASCAVSGGAQARLPLGGDLLSPGVTEPEALRAIAPLCARAKRVIVADAKKRLHACEALADRTLEDVALAAYALNPQRPSFSTEALLAQAGLAPTDARGEAAGLIALFDVEMRELARDDLLRLYREIELPLCRTLWEMEREGFLVDQAELKRLGETYRARIAELNGMIQEAAGAPVNINSPKQLGELLFEKLGLKGGKKTQKGYSTTAEELENIAWQHPIVGWILEYRKYFKLNSTYIEQLLRLRAADGRIHTSFDQTATATGRISSLEPNLQNIPVRTQLGREIRRAFIARPGSVLVDADYSQIELRVLAHMSGDEGMRGAFSRGEDIHRRTAAEVYAVPLEAVTSAQRGAAKAVNFGIVYGISEFGLARNIGVTRAEASDFIKRYFERYPRVKHFMDEQVTLGKTQGYVSTLFGRRRYLPELESANYNIRSFGERAAMNSPIQGTAADIIKLAMVRVHARLAAEHLRARLILQVHDELIVEAPEAEAQRVCALVREEMERAATLSVPLTADVSTGGNWDACKE